MPSIALEQEVIAAAITTALVAVFTRFWYAPTQRVQPKPRSDFALRHWLSK